MLGAKFYYLWFVLHEWPDDLCVRILARNVPAMGPHWCIILDETVIPDNEMSLWAASGLPLLPFWLPAAGQSAAQWTGSRCSIVQDYGL